LPPFHQPRPSSRSGSDHLRLLFPDFPGIAISDPPGAADRISWRKTRATMQNVRERLVATLAEIKAQR